MNCGHWVGLGVVLGLLKRFICLLFRLCRKRGTIELSMGVWRILEDLEIDSYILLRLLF